MAKFITHIRPAVDGDPICYAWQVCATGDDGVRPVYVGDVPDDGNAWGGGPVTIPFSAHEIAHNVLMAHTGREGGLPQIDWYKLRGEIADALTIALDNQRKLDTPPANPRLRGLPVEEATEKNGESGD